MQRIGARRVPVAFGEVDRTVVAHHCPDRRCPGAVRGDQRELPAGRSPHQRQPSRIGAVARSVDPDPLERRLDIGKLRGPLPAWRVTVVDREDRISVRREVAGERPVRRWRPGLPRASVDLYYRRSLARLRRTVDVERERHPVVPGERNPAGDPRLRRFDSAEEIGHDQRFLPHRSPHPCRHLVEVVLAKSRAHGHVESAGDAAELDQRNGGEDHREGRQPDRDACHT